MPTVTQNYGIKKPFIDDRYDLTTINENADIIDASIKNVDNRISNIIAQSGTSDTEVIDARGGFITLKNRLDNNDVQVNTSKVKATNLVTNGDFSNGTTGWTNSFSALSVASNTATVTGNGGASSARLEQAESVTNGIKYYLRARARVTNSLATSISLRLWNTVSAQEVQAQATPTINQFYNLSGVITSTNTSAVGAVWVTSFYADATTQNGKVMEVQYVSMINLTAIFGAGKEPTKEQMDWLLAQKFTNSWFNGTAELTSIIDLLTLVNTKANITQETWITPTLLNGWANHAGGEPVQYFKDQFGIVRMKGWVSGGTLSQPAFILPVGYRPKAPYSQTFPCAVLSNDAFRRVGVLSNGNVTVYGIITYIDLSSITFKVEG